MRPVGAHDPNGTGRFTGRQRVLRAHRCHDGRGGPRRGVAPPPHVRIRCRFRVRITASSLPAGIQSCRRRFRPGCSTPAKRAMQYLAIDVQRRTQVSCLPCLRGVWGAHFKASVGCQEHWRVVYRFLCDRQTAGTHAHLLNDLQTIPHVTSPLFTSRPAGARQRCHADARRAGLVVENEIIVPSLRRAFPRPSRCPCREMRSRRTRPSRQQNHPCSTGRTPRWYGIPSRCRTKGS